MYIIFEKSSLMVVSVVREPVDLHPIKNMDIIINSNIFMNSKVLLYNL